MEISRKIGDSHVLAVCKTLQDILSGNVLHETTQTAMETVAYITQLYPNIKTVSSKFETNNPDANPDLLIVLDDNQKIRVNLFLLKGKAAIQPKNLGAKSFLEKYFLSSALQTRFNRYFEHEYTYYISSLFETTEDVKAYNRLSEMKRKVKEMYPKFTEDIQLYRERFLFTLREYCFQLLQEEYNEDSNGIQNAWKELLMADCTNIITRYFPGNKSPVVEKFEPNQHVASNVSIYKKGKNSIGIRYGEEALLIRFKFESNPVSSIKLATSYEKFPAEDIVLQHNMETMANFERILESHRPIETRNTSNAIGKCNEAMVYYQVLKTNPTTTQIDSSEYQRMLERYSPLVQTEDLIALEQSAEVAVQKLEEYLIEKHAEYKIDSIELVPENYLKDRLDTSDLQLVLIVDNYYVQESFSLKALAKKNVKITSKNPGIGQILGPQYFSIGTDRLDYVVREVRETFSAGNIDHYGSLVEVSTALGVDLQQASQEQLQKGIQALLGNSTLVITFYKQRDSVILEHGNVTSEIDVVPQHPSPIQTTLYWNEKQEELTLRVKFSAGQDKGWSSLKLACETKINVV